MRPRCANAAFGLAVMAVVGCSEPPPVDTLGVEPPGSWLAIPDSMPAGSLHGVAFEAKDARLYVNDQPGRQWVTVSLSAATAKNPCAPRDPVDAASVWIRLPGKLQEALKVRELKRAAGDDDSGWAVHYQIFENGQWVGHSHAAALFAIRRSKPGYGIDGELAVCFADAKRSCVQGSFTARQCPNPFSPEVRQIAPGPAFPSAAKPAKPKASSSAGATAAPTTAPFASASAKAPR